MRPVDITKYVRGHSLINSVRVFSAQAKLNSAPEVNFQDEWNSAKPYKSIPGVSKVGFIRRFLPGGEFKVCKVSLTVLKSNILGKYHKIGLSELNK